MARQSASSGRATRAPAATYPRAAAQVHPDQVAAVRQARGARGQHGLATPQESGAELVVCGRWEGAVSSRRYQIRVSRRLRAAGAALKGPMRWNCSGIR